MFQSPTLNQLESAQRILDANPQAHALHSLTVGEHISSGIIDEAIHLLLRPVLPPATTALLSSDAQFIQRTDMPRNHRRIQNVIQTHTVTLVPLNASSHWFLAEINTQTRILTFRNSAGTLGQGQWKATLLRLFRKNIGGPWRSHQGPMLQQPGGTECGTHTLLSIMRHIPHAPHPDTSDIQWSLHMRTYLLTSITQAGYTPYSNEESDSDAVTAQPGRKKKKTERKPVMGKKRKRSPSPHYPTY